MALGGLMAALASGTLLGQEVDTTSVFSTPQQVAKPTQQSAQAPNALDNLEFNGVMTIGGVTRISVYDKQAKRNYWIVQDKENDAGLRLVRHDTEKDLVVVSMGGVSRVIALKKPRIEPLKIAEEPVPRPNIPPPPGVDAGEASATDEEVRERMRRVAEEIRRRRMERREQIESGRGGNNN